MLYYIQVLRGIAALLVVLFHYRIYLDGIYSKADLGTALAGQGYMGVDIFFALSGFIIVYSTRKVEHAHPVDFLIRRVFRVVPLGWVATLSFFILEGAVHSIPVLAKSLAFIPLANTNPPFLGYSLYGVVWTLSFELYFYAVFCLTLAFTHRFRTIVAGSFIFLGIYYFQTLLTGSWSLDPHAQSLPDFSLRHFPIQLFSLVGSPLSLDFVAGMVLGECYDRFAGSIRQVQGFWLWTAALVLFGIFLSYYLGGVGSGHGILNKGIGAISLVAGCLLIEARAHRTPHAGFWFFLGSISYPLYLVHNGITDRLIRRIPGVYSYLWNFKGVLLWSVYIAVSIALAYIIHRLLELPLQKAARQIIQRLATKRKDQAIARSEAWLSWKLLVTIVLLIGCGLGLVEMRRIQSTDLISLDKSFQKEAVRWPVHTVKLLEFKELPGHSGDSVAHVMTDGQQFIQSKQFYPAAGGMLRVDASIHVVRGAVRIMLLQGAQRKLVGELHDYVTKESSPFTFISSEPMSGEFVTLNIDDYHERSEFYVDHVRVRPQW